MSQLLRRHLSHSTVRALAYGATSFGASALHSVFITHHVALFLTYFKITNGWFYAGEICFAVWNALSGPVLSHYLSDPSGSSTFKHLQAIQYGGAIWAFAALVPYFPLWHATTPLRVGLHFFAALLFYETMLVYVTMAHAALLADLSSSPGERAKCNTYSSVLGAVGGSAVFFSNFYWDVTNLHHFKWFALVLSICAYVAFQLTAEYCYYDVYHAKRDDDETTTTTAAEAAGGGHDDELVQTTMPVSRPLINDVVSSYGSSVAVAAGGGDDGDDAFTGEQPPRSWRTYWAFVWQIRVNRNFWLFVCINFVQVLNCHFNSNFLTMWMQHFLPMWSVAWRSTLLTLCSVLPHAVVVALQAPIARRGLPAVMRSLYRTKVLVCAAALPLGALGVVDGGAHGAAAALAVAAFLLCNKVFTEAICRLGNLLLSDLIDEDQVLHARLRSASLLMHGVNSLCTKPAQSLAPMLGWTALRAIGYETFERLQQRAGDVAKHAAIVQAAATATATVAGGGVLVDLRGIETHLRPINVGPTMHRDMFWLLVLVPMACGVVQLLLWSRYTLKGSRLEQVRQDKVYSDSRA